MSFDLSYQDLKNPLFMQDPLPFFNQLLEESTLQKIGGVWLAASFDDCNNLLKEKNIGREIEGLETRATNFDRNPLLFLMQHVFAMRDAPNHSRIRSALNPHFQPQEIARYGDIIIEEANQLISSFKHDRVVDLMYQYAEPLPFRIISLFIGIPAHYEQDLVTWVHDFRKGFEEVLPPINQEIIRNANAALNNLYALFKHLISLRAKKPQNDLISRFLISLEAGQVTEDELIASTLLMLPAGTQTTLQTISNSIYVLLNKNRHRQYVAMCKSEQAVAVEELLRYETPVKCLMRIIKSDFTYKGQQLRKGEKVCFFYSAANRDRIAFAEPEKLDLSRVDNRQMAFSAGAHHCLGVHLGRLEVRLALDVLFKRFPDIRLVDKKPIWEDSFFSRELIRLPVHL